MLVRLSVPRLQRSRRALRSLGELEVLNNDNTTYAVDAERGRKEPMPIATNTPRADP